MTQPNEKSRLVIDLVADPVCPWCYVGLRSLFSAREKLGDDHEAIIRLRPYQLNPDTPLNGVDRQAYYEKKFPDAAQRAQMQAALTAAASEAGFAFDPSTPKHLPNTLMAHRLIRWAHYKGLHEAVALKIYQAFWDDGADIGDVDVLTDIAEAAGLPGPEIRARLSAGDDAGLVAKEASDFRAAGVTGVPTYIVNERTGFSGAMPPDKLAGALAHAAAA